MWKPSSCSSSLTVSDSPLLVGPWTGIISLKFSVTFTSSRIGHKTGVKQRAPGKYFPNFKFSAHTHTPTRARTHAHRPLQHHHWREFVRNVRTKIMVSNFFGAWWCVVHALVRWERIWLTFLLTSESYCFVIHGSLSFSALPCIMICCNYVVKTPRQFSLSLFFQRTICCFHFRQFTVYFSLFSFFLIPQSGASCPRTFSTLVATFVCIQFYVILYFSCR